MTQIIQLQVRRNKLDDVRIVTLDPQPLLQGQVLIEVEKFALTANNITYGVVGDRLGYWKFFPAEDDWGIIPVWGFGRVVESQCAEVATGARYYGYFPTASHVVMQPGKVRAQGFEDMAPNRAGLAAVYNRYADTRNDPPALAAMEDARAIYFPLFSTSFVIYDYLLDNDWFGAEQVVIASASSKTAFGLAHLIYRHEGARPRVIGLTSPGNRTFVEGLKSFDQVVAYDDLESQIGLAPSALVDMAGNRALIGRLHHHLGDQVKLSCGVGVTHWSAASGAVDALPGAKPQMFFAPAQFAKRDQDWGPGEALRRAGQASSRIAIDVAPLMQVTHGKGSRAVEAAYRRTLMGQVRPDEALILSF